MKNTLPLFALLSILLLSACNKPNPDIAQWRGPDRNGIFPETGLQDQWSGEGPEVKWICEGLGRGYASPAAGPDGIYVKGESDGNEILVALDPEGEKRWTAPNGKAFLGEGFSATYPGARSTPTVYGDRVYTTSGMGEVACFDAGSGDKIWALNIVDDLDGVVGYFGYSESPVVDEDHVYIFPAGQEHNICALDRNSGTISWSTRALRDTFAYGSPILADLPEAEVLMLTSRHHIQVLDKHTGELLSSYRLEGFEYDGEHCNSLIFEDGFIHFVANDTPGQGAMKLRVSADGRTIQEVWRNPEVLNNFGGFLVLDGSIYTTLKGNKLVILDKESGAISDSLKTATGSLIFADGKILSYGNNGAVSMFLKGEDGLEHRGTWKVQAGKGQHFSHPVVQDGILYIRRGDALAAYRIKNL